VRGAALLLLAALALAEPAPLAASGSPVLFKGEELLAALRAQL
jgi:hypothetical protein